MPSKPAHAPTHPDADQPEPSREELRIVQDRMRTFEQDRKAARPAEEVMERLLRRHPAP